tara:strand:+ start:503 stop:739 length:237 start_codon:yes stop_codon:yes gene_type:complete
MGIQAVVAKFHLDDDNNLPHEEAKGDGPNPAALEDRSSTNVNKSGLPSSKRISKHQQLTLLKQLKQNKEQQQKGVKHT